MKYLVVVLVSFFFLGLTSCGLSLDLVDTTPSVPDYTNLSSWSAHPEIADDTDESYSGLVLNQFNIPVFFASPTVHFPEKGGSWNADIGNLDVRSSFGTPVKYQASAFNVAGPVYAPYYRQAAYQVYNVAPNVITTKSYHIAYEDVKNAFEQFMSEIGPETSYILASHSQGTDHLETLLKSHLTNAQLDHLVAAYLIGMEVDQCAMPIPLCEIPNQTGCFVSWRTYHKSVRLNNKYDPECIGVVNPISWKTTTEFQSAELNNGALINTERELYPGLVGATIKGGIIITERPHFPGSRLMRTKNYHRGDINLYYLNIQENVLVRCLSYQKER
ncbi:MAG TPA: hypothetical protein DHU80_06580 [Cryomorphaceae bacterium]|nr:hypothetical protein [Cryomorphaceae bacterium]HCY25883.1 hypothetical protein [Cryomorphaceae bacterium]|tara:strand:+ start:1673 stop:2665 length:993 start_codon:yes stop_codon:yes gene_type:complete